MDQKHRILIVDDHTLFRAGLRALLFQDPDVEVVGEAADGRDAIRAVGQLAPHLVLMDLSMPLMNGMEAMTEIKRRYPDVRVLVMTLHKTEDYIHASLKAGADGYILKDATHEEFLVAIRNVLLGKTYLSLGVSTTVVTGYLSGGKSSGASSTYDTLGHQVGAVFLDSLYAQTDGQARPAQRLRADDVRHRKRTGRQLVRQAPRRFI